MSYHDGHRALSSITPCILITFNRIGRNLDRRVGFGSQHLTLSVSRSSFLQPVRHLNGAAQSVDQYTTVHNKAQKMTFQMSRFCIVPLFTCCQHQSRHENSNTGRHFNAPWILQGTRTRNFFPLIIPLHCPPTVRCCLATVDATFHLYSILTQYHFLCHLHSLRWHSLHSYSMTMNNWIHSV